MSVTCARCGRERRKGRARGLCDPCYTRLRRAGQLDDYPRRTRRGPELVEDVEWLLRNQFAAETIAARVQLSPRTLARNLYRLARPDLARPFARIDSRERQPGHANHPCAACGRSCSPRATRCRACYDADRYGFAAERAA